MQNENDQDRDVKRSRTPRRLKLYAALVLLFVATFASVAYALQTITIANTGTVTLATKDWQGITFSPPTTSPSCSVQSTYSDNPAPMAWGNIGQGASATGYICVKDLGGTGSTYIVTTSVAPPAGITVTYNGTATITSLPLNSGQTSLINVVVSVGLTAGTGTFSYTTTIQ